MYKEEIQPYPGKGFEPCPEDKGWLPLNVPTELNINTTKLAKDFAEALLEKLLKSQRKYGYTDGWRNQEWIPDMQQAFSDHVEKGDPLDVAAYCAFLWHHGVSTSSDKNPDAIEVLG